MSFLRPKLFVNLWTFEVGTLPVISLSPNWTVYIFYFGPCAIRCVKVNFLSDIFAKLTFEKFSPRKIFVPLEDFSELSERDILIWKIFLDERKSLKNLEKTFWLIQNFYKVENLDSKAERSWTQTGTQHLCITNKQLSVHVSSVEKDVAINKDGYSIQLAEWKRGNRGELFAAEPAPSRAVRSSVPHLGLTTAWARSPGESARWVSSWA